MAIQKRNQKAVTQDPDVLFRIGINRNFTANKQIFDTTLEIANPDGGTFTMTKGWRIIERKFDTEKELQAACKVAPLLISVSRSKPNVIIRKGDVPQKTLQKLIDFLNKVPFMLDRNDREQYDPYLEEAIGPKANAEWYFEDMRTARKQKISTNEDTIEIGAKLHEMKGDVNKLRDALFLIGEAPTKDDTAEDLYFMLSDKVITDPKSKTRRMFIKYFVNPEMTEKEISLLKWVNKGVASSVIEARNGFLVYGSERLGVDEREAVEYLGYSEDVLRSLKVAVSNATGMKEDIKAANKVIEAVDGSADTARAISYISDKMKSSGLSSAPHMVLRGVDNVNDAVSKYNAKAKDAGLTKAEYISTDFVLDEIGAEA